MSLLTTCLFLVSLGLLARANNDDQCYEYYGGLVYPQGWRRTVEHSMHWSKTQSAFVHYSFNLPTIRSPSKFGAALGLRDSSLVTMAQHVIARSLLAVSKPAPDWNGTAVVNRDFVELKLSDFKGTRQLAYTFVRSNSPFFPHTRISYALD